MLFRSELWLVGRIRDGYQVPEETEGLRYLGGVDDADLPELYSGAIAFVYPSHYEGFGLPVLEAMQCGCPVITSLDPAISEVSAGATIQVDARDVTALRTAMESLLLHDELHETHREAGLARAAQFQWSETARRTREVYEIGRAHV